MKKSGTLYFLAGKMGAGKSTKAKELKLEKNAVLLSEDEWLEELYPNEIKEFKDYLRLSTKIKPLIKKHVQNILNTGTNVVMDFPGNTKKQREWLISIANEIQSNHTLIFLNMNDEQCLKNIKKRNDEQPERKDFDNKETFEYVSSFFEIPTKNEKINILEVKNNI